MRIVNAQEFDLVILDLMLPGRDGLQVLATLRRRGMQTPVLVLTARDAIEEMNPLVLGRLLWARETDGLAGDFG